TVTASIRVSIIKGYLMKS
ncbi:bacterial regulatory helix-turn-helix, lysR family protein, partial [Vibrio parahaemolyticus V-223/04]